MPQPDFEGFVTIEGVRSGDHRDPVYISDLVDEEEYDFHISALADAWCFYYHPRAAARLWEQGWRGWLDERFSY